jgi:hypothetical protein
MIENLISIQQEYENYLEVCKITKKNRKKEILKLEKLIKLNDENGIDTTPIMEKLESVEQEFIETDKEISKVKKVIFRIGVCINIMMGGDSEVIETPQESL